MYALGVEYKILPSSNMAQISGKAVATKTSKFSIFRL